jgi:superfamily II DNA or RNA helicase
MIPPPRKHQEEAMRFLVKRGGRGALFMEPGTGKTRIGIDLAHEARTLVVALSRL